MKHLFVTLLCVLATGCVSAGKYNDLEAKDKALEAENEKNKQSLAAAELRISELNGKLGITESARTQLQGSVNEMKIALQEQAKRKAETDKRLAEYRELTSKFKSLVDQGQLTVKVINGKMTVALSTDVLFSSGSAKLNTKGQEAIKEVTQLLSSLVGRHYQIEGHTDNVPIKTASYASNWELASARSMTVLRTMLDSGMPADRVSGASYGDTQPVGTNTTAEGKAMNRRIAIVIVPDLSALPGYGELNEMSK